MNALQEKFAPMKKGMLEFLLLRMINAHKMYVADILKKLETTEFVTGEGTLYPLLSRMRREGLVEYEWQESESGPPRKYYRLTDKGRDQLSALNDYWNQLQTTITTLGQ